MTRKWYDVLKGFLLLIPVPIIFITLGYLGIFQRFENVAMDWRFKIRGELDVPQVKLMYVNIDTPAVEVMGERPIPRQLYADAVQALFELGGARAVGIDIVFSRNSQSKLVNQRMVAQGNARMRQVVQKYPGLTLAVAYTPRRTELSSDTNALIHFPYIADGFTDPDKNDMPERPNFEVVGMGGTFGLINVAEKFSGGAIPRYVPVFAKTPLPTYYTMALTLIRAYYGLNEDAIKIYPDRVDLQSEDGKILVSIPLFHQQVVEINWFSKFYSQKNVHISLGDLLINLQLLKMGTDEDKLQVLHQLSQFKDAIVLIGPTDPLFHDLAPTPFDDSPVPKVGVHGNLIKTFISGLFIKHVPQWANIVILLALTGLVTTFGTYSGDLSRISKGVSILVLVTYIYLVFYYFNLYHLVLPLIQPVGSAMTAVFLGVIYKLLLEERQRQRIKGMFGTYVSPELVHRMVESGEEPQLGGHEEIITCFFSDIQSFSTFSEVLTPERLVELMNEYLNDMTNELQDKGGALDKYIGDAIVAMFGAPVPLEDHALAACIVSQRMQAIQAAMREKWKNEEKNWPVVVHRMRTRIGLNTGPAIVGNMGSESRFNYTMMGDTVNLAARCESGAKSYGVYTMVTEDTKVEAEKFGNDCVFRFLDKIIVKGRSKPVSMYEIMGLRDEAKDGEFDCLEVFDSAIAKHNAQDWDSAVVLFEKSADLESLHPDKNPGVPTNPSLVMIERCRYYQGNPPGDDWDGVFVMTSK